MVVSLGIEGEPWTDAENDLLVEDYLDMLKADIAGEKVPKTARREGLRQIGLGARSLKSIEAKQQNLSAVFELLGYRHAIGLRPLPNYQDALVAAFWRGTSSGRLDLLIENDVILPAMSPVALDKVFVTAPAASSKPLPPGLAALVRKIDPAERDRRARELGKAGEAFVMDIERQKLEASGQGHLVGDLRWVADVEGDGHGYDIRSFDEKGEEMHIEVKTTNGGATTPFMMTSNEDVVSRRDKSWTLYRVHRFFREPQIFVLDPPIWQAAAMETAIWKVSPGRLPST